MSRQVLVAVLGIALVGGFVGLLGLVGMVLTGQHRPPAGTSSARRVLLAVILAGFGVAVGAFAFFLAWPTIESLADGEFDLDTVAPLFLAVILVGGFVLGVVRLKQKANGPTNDAQ